MFDSILFFYYSTVSTRYYYVVLDSTVELYKYINVHMVYVHPLIQHYQHVGSSYKLLVYIDYTMFD